MNKDEQKAFDKCVKAIRRLILEERQTKRKLKKIQEEKINCIRVLINDEYCEEILKGDSNA